MYCFSDASSASEVSPGHGHDPVCGCARESTGPGQATGHMERPGTAKRIRL